MTPEDEEFAHAALQHVSEQERLGRENWMDLYMTRSFTFPLPASLAGTGTDWLRVRVRELPTSAAIASGHDLGASGLGGTGDMSASGVHTWGAAVALSHLLARVPVLGFLVRFVLYYACPCLPLSRGIVDIRGFVWLEARLHL